MDKTKEIIAAGIGIAGAIILARYYNQIQQFINLATNPQVSTTTSTSTTSSTSTTTYTPPSTGSSGGSSSSSSSSSGSGGPSYSYPPNPLQSPTSCPSCLQNGSCYQLSAQCFSPTQVNVNNNTNTQYGIEVQLQLPASGYCGTSGFYNTASGLLSPNTSCNLTGYYCSDTTATCFGVVYAYPNNQSPPYMYWYYYYNNNINTEVDLNPIATVRITNNCSEAIYVTPVWSFYTNYHYYTVQPGQTLDLSVGNGWSFTVGNADLVNQVGAVNPSVNVYWFSNGVKKLNGSFTQCYAITTS